jgi:hypothetical protein
MLMLPALAAADCSILFGGWSYHADREQDYNETHDMIGVQCRGVSAMKFTNSYDKEAYGVGYDYTWRTFGPVAVGAYAAVWTGYRDALTPVGGLRARYTIGRFSVVATTALAVTTAHLEWRF